MVLAAVSELIAPRCAVGLWRSRGSVTRRVVCMLVFLVPLFAPIFYGGMCELPSVPGKGFRGEDNWGEHHSSGGLDEGTD
jgi:hypothetical protein